MGDQLQKLQDEALDRLRNAGNPFELDKARAIADFVRWMVEQESPY